MVDDLSLYKFLKSKLVVQYEKSTVDYLVWIHPFALSDFYKLVGDCFFEDGDIVAHLLMDSVCIDISCLNDCNEIDLDRVFGIEN